MWRKRGCAYWRIETDSAVWHELHNEQDNCAIKKGDLNRRLIFSFTTDRIVRQWMHSDWRRQSVTHIGQKKFNRWICNNKSEQNNCTVTIQMMSVRT